MKQKPDGRTRERKMKHPKPPVSRKDSGGLKGDANREKQLEESLKTGEEALRHTSDLLQAVLDNAPAGVAVADSTGKIILTNAALEEIFGGPVTGTAYGPAGGYHLLTLDGSPFPSEELPLTRALLKGVSVRAVEILVKRDSGSQAVILASANPLRDSAGEITGAITVLQDITARKQVEDALRDSEERLRLAQQAGHVGMLEWDLATDKATLSDEMKAIYGVPPDFESTLENWAKVTPPQDIREVLGKTERAIAAHDREVESEYRVVHPDGEVRWLSSRGIIYYDDTCRPVRMIVTAIDITDLKNAQDYLQEVNQDLEERVYVRTQELREANSMLRAQTEELQNILNARKKMEQDLMRLATAIDQAGEGIVLFNSDLLIEYVNPAYERMSGYTREELMSKGPEFLSSLTLNESYPELPYEFASKGEIWSGHVTRKRKSGETVDMRLTVSPVRNETGNILNYVSVVQDITHEIRFQQLMVQSQKMEAIGTLAGGIAHDLKNIFTPILINSEIAVEDIGRDNPVYPLLEEILEAARLGTDLVKQIMTFTRQTSEEKVKVDISSLVSETLSLLRSAIPKTIDIRTSYNAGGTVVQANPTQIKQVLMNLGSNAAYAMRGQSGLLEVDVSCIDLDRDAASKISPDLASGSYVEVNVMDTGEGMDEMTLQRIFDPFFTTKQHGEGTGMGLSVVQGIIKGHQGAISVWSKPGKGSTFKILLPKLEKGCSEGRNVQ